MRAFVAVAGLLVLIALPGVAGAGTGGRPGISPSLTFPGAGPGGSTATWVFGPWIVSTNELTVTMKHSAKLKFVGSSRTPSQRSATTVVWHYVYPHTKTGLCCSTKGLTIRVHIPTAPNGTTFPWSITAVAKNATGTTTTVKSAAFKVTG